MSAHERLLALRDSDLCAGLSAVQIKRLAAVAQPKSFEPGDFLIEQGRVVDAVHLPCSGCIMVERCGREGQRQVLAFLKRGYFLGVDTSDRYMVSAIALERSQVLRFPIRDFQQLKSDLAVLRDNVGYITNVVLVRAQDHLFAVGQKRAHARLAFLLRELCVGQLPDGSELSLQLPMSRADIGDYLGLTPESTSRAFSRLRSDGVIRTPNRSTVVVQDWRTLQMLAEVE